jgi:hypothetical protein
MAPRLGGKATGESETTVPVATGDAPDMKMMMAKMAELQSRMLQDSEWVGRRFADEARAIHHGETEHRTIHGQATAAEAAALSEEGVGVMPLPFPIVPPDQTH